MKFNSKIFLLLLIVTTVLITSPQVARAEAAVNVVSSVVSTVVNVVSVAVNVVVGTVETGIGIAGNAVGALFGNGSWGSGLIADGENRVVNGFTGVTTISGSAPIDCYAGSSVVVVGSPAIWKASGGPQGERFTLVSDTKATAVKGDPWQIVNLTTSYPTLGVKTAQVDALFGNRSDGRKDCSGSITVVANASQLPLGNKNPTGPNNPNDPNNPNNINNLGNNLGSPLGSQLNPINLGNGLCTAVQAGSAANVYVNKNMTWSIPSFPSAQVKLSDLSLTSVKWNGTDISSSKPSLSFDKIYTTIGQKVLSVWLMGKIGSQYYTASCVATTTIRAASSTVSEI